MLVSSDVHEEQFVRAFLPKLRQERALFLLADPKHRRKFTEALAHFSGFDTRFTTPIPASLARTPSELVALLRSKSAGGTVHIISEVLSLDGRTFELADAMNLVWGQQSGSIISCIPGRLAFFRGEGMKSELLLQRAHST